MRLLWGLKEKLSDVELLSTDVIAKIRDISQKYRGVMVSLSGGADSIGLLDVFYRLSNAQKNFSVAAIHIAYGLRGSDSRSDFAHCAELCQNLGIPLYTTVITEIDRQSRAGEGIQAWARRLRHASYQPWVDRGWVIALAHHNDDLAENVLMRLARGSAPENLLGMQFYKHPFLRPFLNISKKDIAAYNHQRGLTWREDLSNATNDYTRNTIRNEILPRLEELFPGCTQRIVACAEDATDLAIGDPASKGMLRQRVATQLSRRYLDAAIKYGIEAAPPPGTVPDSENPKAKRAHQHRASLTMPITPAIISAGSYGFFNLDKR